MKKTHIIAIVMIVAAIGIFATAADDMGTYSTFQIAINDGGKVKIAGQLSKDKEMHYNPEEDPNFFTFFIKDSDGAEKKVILKAAKPQDFELSEQIVVTGKMVGDDFVASDLLMKCPSKYKDEEVYIKSQES